MVHKFTDNQLAELYSGLSAHYDQLKTAGFDETTIFQQLAHSIKQMFDDPTNKLHNLAIPNQTHYNEEERNKINFLIAEQYKVWNVLAVVYASKTKSAMTASQVPHLRDLYSRPITILHVLPPEIPYCRHDNDILWWLTFNNMSHFHSHHHASHGLSGCGGGSGKSDGEVFFFFLLLVIAAIAIILAAYCLYYIMKEFLNSIERFVFNEGWLQASITLSAMLAGGAAGAAAGTLLAATPIIMLALAAGVSNPVGWVILGIVCLTIVGAAAGTFVANKLQNYVLKKASADELVPNDANRFSLTDSEAAHLVSIGIDPVAVKCAITELRAQMGCKEIPGYADRKFFKADQYKYLQENLDLIRQLRRGQLEKDNTWDSFKVGDKTFDLVQRNIYFWPTFEPVQQVAYYPEAQQVVSYEHYQYGNEQNATQHHGSHPYQDQYQSQPYIDSEPSQPYAASYQTTPQERIYYIQPDFSQNPYMTNYYPAMQTQMTNTPPQK